MMMQTYTVNDAEIRREYRKTQRYKGVHFSIVQNEVRSFQVVNRQGEVDAEFVDMKNGSSLVKHI